MKRLCSSVWFRVVFGCQTSSEQLLQTNLLSFLSCLALTLWSSETSNEKERILCHAYLRRAAAWMKNHQRILNIFAKSFFDTSYLKFIIFQWIRQKLPCVFDVNFSKMIFTSYFKHSIIKNYKRKHLKLNGKAPNIYIRIRSIKYIFKLNHQRRNLYSHYIWPLIVCMFVYIYRMKTRNEDEHV